LRAQQPVELLEMRDEVAAALGWAGMDDELPRDVIEESDGSVRISVCEACSVSPPIG
jgi:hypothetical protein